jgi:Flp pilus assembly protein TadD
MQKELSLTNVVCLCLAGLAACTSQIPARKPVPSAPPQERGAKTDRAAPSPDGEIPITSVSAAAIERFKAGRDLFAALRPDEANEQFKKAIELDPGFAQAHAYLGIHLPGPEGQMALERAFELGKNLPEAERTLVQMIVADKRGDAREAEALTRRLVELAPGDWRTHEGLGTRASDAGRLDEASTEFQKAIELNPNAAVLHNEMGYVLLRQGKKDAAVRSFQRYAELAGDEPNAYDSLGDSLLAGSRFEEAEKAYRRAAELVPQFYVAWQGVAAARALRGEWNGAYEALTKARASAARTAQKLQNDEVVAMTQLANGRAAEALRTIDAAVREATNEKLAFPAASAQLVAAYVLLETNKPREALDRLDRAVSILEGDVGKRALRTRWKSQALRATAYDRLAQKGEVARVLAALQRDVGERAQQDPFAQSSLRYVQGLVDLAGGDRRSAAEHFVACGQHRLDCKYREVIAREGAGDAAGAEGAKRRFLDTPTRDPEYIYVRAKMVRRP